MRAIRYCLCVVRKGQTPPSTLDMGPKVSEVSDFLTSHAQGLQKSSDSSAAASKAAPIARFITQRNTKVQFEHLVSGSDSEFLAAAKTFATDLIKQMEHKNAKQGVLVCATFEDEGRPPSAAVLKLEVVSEHGAVLQGLETNHVTLSAIQHVLDRPGDLQKGAVYPDPRPESDTVVADRVSQVEAQYFLTAVGIEVVEPGKKALGVVAQVLSDAARPDDRRRIVRQLQEAASGDVEQVINEASTDVELAHTPAELAESLRVRERPIRTVDTSFKIKRQLVAGRLKVDLGDVDPENVSFDELPSGEWEIRIRVDAKPLWRYGT